MVAVPIVAIVMVSVMIIVWMSLKHDENITRIKNGYPTREQEREALKKAAANAKESEGFVDMTVGNDKREN